MTIHKTGSLLQLIALIRLFLLDFSYLLTFVHYTLPHRAAILPGFCRNEFKRLVEHASLCSHLNKLHKCMQSSFSGAKT